MPFTLSHPAAAIPLRRALPWTVLTALVIGSMAPDFPYFIGLGDLRFRTHDFSSVATFSVPVGLAAYFVFERWLRAPWRDLLPAPLAARVAPAPTPPAWLAVGASLALGALTHVVWDSFTHEHEPGVRLVNALNVVVVELLGFPVRGYNLLQHGSTLFGLAALVLAMRSWVRRTPRGALPVSWLRAAAARRMAPWLVFAGFAPTALSFALLAYPPGASLISLRSFVGALVISGMSLTLAALLLYVAWWWRFAASSRPHATRRALAE